MSEAGNTQAAAASIPEAPEGQKPQVVDVTPPQKPDPTPEQIEEAKQYVVSKEYDYAGASKIVAQYGALFLLEAKQKEEQHESFGPAIGQPGQPGETEFPVQLPPGSVTVRVFDYDTRKALHIMEQRDAGNEFDVYVRTR
jgi:hypothetical protein